MHIYQSRHNLRIPSFFIKLFIYHFRVHEQSFDLVQAENRTIMLVSGKINYLATTCANTLEFEIYICSSLIF